uniref:ATP synthase subunit a n=1 Tax=Lamprigera yunnana TaxID=370605 RepID=A0A5C0PWE8_9COLE|nr:ATP synthase F0 subunit 6 [Lamprigera yunnana]QEJ81504.1 ATP synthase F0 subunit 6 [Lamprigera yunnana]
MMMNLFSSFDPSTSNNLSLNWYSIIMCILFLPLSFWLLPSRINFLWIYINLTLNKEMKTIINMNSLMLMMISLFTSIFLMNMLALMPYFFSMTSHLILTLSFSLPMWMSFMIYGWMNNYIYMFAHLVPMNTPMILIPFMICIETISNIIRPMTLAIRLTANMIAGHLILTLIGNLSSNLNFLPLSLLIIVQLIFMSLELMVCMIQAYVFTTLMTLYSSEIY